MVRPHPELERDYQILDGHQRAEVLRELGRDDEPVIEEAIRQAAADLDGRNRRGGALAAICRAHLEDIDA